jgi:uncharacterized MAPEG superfamily protein
MTPELTWLTATAFITALMWLPYILMLIVQMGLVGALTDPQHETEIETRWARRAKRAHTNAVENLVVFAPLAIAVHLTGMGSETTATICAVFFYTRLAHYVVYTAGIPVIRTLLFAVGWACQMMLALTLLGWA